MVVVVLLGVVVVLFDVAVVVLSGVVVVVGRRGCVGCGACCVRQVGRGGCASRGRGCWVVRRGSRGWGEAVAV